MCYWPQNESPAMLFPTWIFARFPPFFDWLFQSRNLIFVRKSKVDKSRSKVYVFFTGKKGCHYGIIQFPTRRRISKVLQGIRSGAVSVCLGNFLQKQCILMKILGSGESLSWKFDNVASQEIGCTYDEQLWQQQEEEEGWERRRRHRRRRRPQFQTLPQKRLWTLSLLGNLCSRLLEPKITAIHRLDIRNTSFKSDTCNRGWQ